MILDLTTIEFPLLVIAAVANLALGIIVFQFAERNRSRYLFSLFVLAQVAWIAVNYFNFHIPPRYFLIVVRLTLFFATYHALFFFLFVYTFLSDQPFPKRLVFSAVAFQTAVAILTLSPLVFYNPHLDPNGKMVPDTGPAIALFGSFVAFCVGAGFYIIVRKFFRATGLQRIQWKYLAWGLFLTFALVLAFSFLNPILFNNITTVRFGHIYTLPFVVFTAYAMVKHKLLNIKTIAAELAAILLNFVLLIQLVNSNSVSQYLVNAVVFAGTLILGVLLVRGVMKEIKQREELQILSIQLKQANDKLKQLDQARADFITIASHQLRTPPATIKWYLGALLSGDYGEVPADIKTQLEKTQVSNNGLIALIDDMLNASRIERGKMEFMFEPIDLQAVAQGAVDQLMPLATMKHLELVYNKPTQALPPLIADQEKLRQVINNIIDNALKYTPSGTVTVNLFQKQEDLVLTVTDTGKGIGKDEAAKLFEKYNRGKSSVTHAPGLGLGLYVAKIIIDQHRGKIWAESPGEGQGSTFAFSIPVNSGVKETALVDLAQPSVPASSP